MFYDYIYLDMDRVLAYGTRLGIMKPDESSVTELEKSVQNTNSAEVGYTGNKEVLKKYSNIDTNEKYFEEFERKLDDVKVQGFYNDFTDNSEEFNDIYKLRRQAIIKFDSKLQIPEEFGQAEFINQVLDSPVGKQALFQSIGDDDLPAQFFSSMINNDRNIPVFFELDGYYFYSSLKSGILSTKSYSDFEDSVDSDVTVVAKIEKIDNVDKDIVIYDMYKDMFKMNRAMRKSIMKSGSGKQSDIQEQITIRGKSVKIAILAIYK